MLNLNLGLRKYQTNPNWGIFCKLIDQYFSEISTRERQCGRQIAPPSPQMLKSKSCSSTPYIDFQMWDCEFGVCHAKWDDYLGLCMGTNPNKAQLSPLSDCEMQKQEGKSQRHQVWENLMTWLWAEMPSTGLGIGRAMGLKDSSILSFRTQGLNSVINVN
jgi:hypothetical protein